MSKQVGRPRRTYNRWRKNLPENLQSDENYYLKEAFRAGLEPQLAEDGYYHLPSRNPKTGHILKHPSHPTFNMGLDYDKEIGYNAYQDNKGRVYTFQDNEVPKGFVPYQYPYGGRVLYELGGGVPLYNVIYDKQNGKVLDIYNISGKPNITFDANTMINQGYDKSYADFSGVEKSFYDRKNPKIISQTPAAENVVVGTVVDNNIDIVGQTEEVIKPTIGRQTTSSRSTVNSNRNNNTTTPQNVSYSPYISNPNYQQPQQQQSTTNQREFSPVINRSLQQLQEESQQRQMMQELLSNPQARERISQIQQRVDNIGSDENSIMNFISDPSNIGMVLDAFSFIPVVGTVFGAASFLNTLRNPNASDTDKLLALASVFAGPLGGAIKGGAKIAKLLKNAVNVTDKGLQMNTARGAVQQGYNIYEDVNNRKMSTQQTKAMGGRVRFNNGGQVPIEAEGGEVLEDTQGNVFDIQGASHEQGGVDLDVPEGSMVFSERLQVGGKTMAERKKTRENREARIQRLRTRGVDFLLENALKRTQQANQIEEQQDIQLQEQAQQMVQQQVMALGGRVRADFGMNPPIWDKYSALRQISPQEALAANRLQKDIATAHVNSNSIYDIAEAANQMGKGVGDMFAGMQSYGNMNNGETETAIANNFLNKDNMDVGTSLENPELYKGTGTQFQNNQDTKLINQRRIESGQAPLNTSMATLKNMNQKNSMNNGGVDIMGMIQGVGGSGGFMAHGGRVNAAYGLTDPPTEFYNNPSQQYYPGWDVDIYDSNDQDYRLKKIDDERMLFKSVQSQSAIGKRKPETKEYIWDKDRQQWVTSSFRDAPNPPMQYPIEQTMDDITTPHLRNIGKGKTDAKYIEDFLYNIERQHPTGIAAFDKYHGHENTPVIPLQQIPEQVQHPVQQVSNTPEKSNKNRNTKTRPFPYTGLVDRSLQTDAMENLRKNYISRVNTNRYNTAVDNQLKNGIQLSSPIQPLESIPAKQYPEVQSPLFRPQQPIISKQESAPQQELIPKLMEFINGTNISRGNNSLLTGYPNPPAYDIQEQPTQQQVPQQTVPVAQPQQNTALQQPVVNSQVPVQTSEIKADDQRFQDYQRDIMSNIAIVNESLNDYIINSDRDTGAGFSKDIYPLYQRVREAKTFEELSKIDDEYGELYNKIMGSYKTEPSVNANSQLAAATQNTPVAPAVTTPVSTNTPVSSTTPVVNNSVMQTPASTFRQDIAQQELVNQDSDDYWNNRFNIYENASQRQREQRNTNPLNREQNVQEKSDRLSLAEKRDNRYSKRAERNNQTLEEWLTDRDANREQTRETFRNNMFTTGDMLGMAGNLYGAIAPMRNTYANRSGDRVNENYFKNFGKDSLKTIDNMTAYADREKQRQMADLALARNTAIGRNRGNSMGINQMRAMDLVTDLGINQARNQAEGQYNQQLMGIMGNKAQLQQNIDAQVMGNEKEARIADLQDRDAFYSAISQGQQDLGKAITASGSSLNRFKERGETSKWMNLMNKYGYINDKGEFVWTNKDAFYDMGIEDLIRAMYGDQIKSKKGDTD